MTARRDSIGETTGRWTNWTGDQLCHPRAFEQPRDDEELAAALARAREKDWEVSVAGAGHSFNNAVLTDGMLLSLDRMNRVLDIDISTSRVRVEGGIRLNELSERLADYGLALENLGDIAVQSLAGATATGTHGTGARLCNISAGIESIELMLHDGTTVVCDKATNAHEWRAARISLGALGVVTRLTMRTVPAFTLHAVDRAGPLKEVIDNLDELVDTNDHFEFYAFPHSETAWTRVNNRVDREPRPRSRPSAWFHDKFLVNTMFGLVCRTGRRFPGLIPPLNRMSAALSGGPERIDRSYRIFASPRHVRFTESEYALPRESAVEALKATLETIERNGYDVPIPLEVRFAASDDALLSPAQGRDTCHISAHMFERMEWKPYFKSFQAIVRESGGRPHWGKRHFETAETLAPLYPEWERFLSVRERFDPDRRFTNDYVRRVLGEIRR